MHSDKEAIVVMNASMARTLLHKGYTIIDIKPDTKDTNRKRSVFIFKNERGLKEEIHNIATKRKAEKQSA